jgi:hypothetical protein
MEESLNGWYQQVTFTRITKSLTNYDLTETETPISFMGLVAPASSEALEMRPEGQRSWRHQEVWASPTLVLSTDDVIVYLGVRYRVVDKTDYSVYGYVNYVLCEDFTPGGP